MNKRLPGLGVLRPKGGEDPERTAGQEGGPVLLSLGCRQGDTDHRKQGGGGEKEEVEEGKGRGSEAGLWRTLPSQRAVTVRQSPSWQSKADLADA